MLPAAVGMPTNVIVNRTSPFNATISWTGVPETQYIVFYQAADSTVRLNQTTTSYSTPLSNLSPFSDYSVFVVAYSTSGNVLPSLPSSTINLQAAGTCQPDTINTAFTTINNSIIFKLCPLM